MNFDEINNSALTKFLLAKRDLEKEYQRYSEDLDTHHGRVLFDMRRAGASSEEIFQAGKDYALEKNELKRIFETRQKLELLNYQRSLNLPAPTIPIKSEFDIMVEEASNVVIAQEADIEL